MAASDVQDVQLTSQISVELVASSNAHDAFVASAARVSTAGQMAEDIDRPVEGLIRALMRDRHGSPFEHNSFSFRVQMPLCVATEHLRHRIGWSYNGESGRFKAFDPTFYIPPSERGLTQVGKAMSYDIQPGSYLQRAHVTGSLTRLAREAFREYEELLANGVAREVARMVLPVNLMTTYWTTCNARSLMAFLSLRTEDPAAAYPSKPMWEIQQVAAGYEDALQTLMPITHAAFCEFGRVAP